MMIADEAVELDDAAVMLLDLGIDQRPAMPPQLRERAFLVDAHQPAVPDHIGRQDGGELAFGPRLTHGSTHRIAAFIIHAAAAAGSGAGGTAPSAGSLP